MLTTIGRQLHDSRRNLVIAAAVGVFAVASDIAWVWWNHYPASIKGRWLIALVGLAFYVYLVRGDLASVGLTATPAQSWQYWIRVTLWIGLAVAGFIVLGLGLWVLIGQKLPVYTTSPQAFGHTFLSMCVFAPVLEETIYRFLICVPLSGLGRPWLAIVTSGVAFGGLHVIYGNPSPENLIGGWFLAWAYLKSGSICLPVLLHSLGNFCVLIAQVGTWQWLNGTG